MRPKMTNNRPMRVLHIMSGFGGGISTFIMNVASQIHNYNIQFDVVTYDEVSPSFLEMIHHTGGDVYALKNPKKEGWKAFVNSYTKVLDLYHYDAIHCHISGYRALVYKSLARSYNIKKFYIHAHHIPESESSGIKENVQNAINQKINRFLSDGLVGCSSAAIKSVFGYDVPINQMMRIPNSIAMERFLYSDQERKILRRAGRERFQLESNQLIFGQIGRLNPIKNHELTLNVAKYMKERQLPGKFIIAGEGDLKEKLQEQIEQEGLQDYVQLIGRFEPIPDFFPMIDALIFPSHREGLGTVAIESQAAGVPVVMSRSIPVEADLGLSLIRRLDIHQSPAEWYEALVFMSQKQELSIKMREEAVKYHQYTNEEAARLYARFILEK